MTEPWPVANLLRSASASDFWSFECLLPLSTIATRFFSIRYYYYCHATDMVNSSTRHVLLLTGRPGVGKTTALYRIAVSLAGWRLAGFYTEEIRESGQRQGFRAVTLDGSEKVIAHRNIHSPYRVGKYRVDLSSLISLRISPWV